MRSNQEYKNAALDRLRGNWAPAVLATLVFLFIFVVIYIPTQLPLYIPIAIPLIIFSSGAVSLARVFLVDPLSVGLSNAIRLLYERRDDRILDNMFQIAFSNYIHKVWGMFLTGIKLLLWTLLLIVPGIIMSFAYAMTPYILEEHPEISAWEASNRSRDMMKGHKLRLFWLQLSFIGWILLCSLTLGIGFLWLGPYMDASVAAFYNDLKAQQGEAAVTE